MLHQTMLWSFGRGFSPDNTGKLTTKRDNYVMLENSRNTIDALTG